MNLYSKPNILIHKTLYRLWIIYSTKQAVKIVQLVSHFGLYGPLSPIASCMIK